MTPELAAKITNAILHIAGETNPVIRVNWGDTLYQLLLEVNNAPQRE